VQVRHMPHAQPHQQLMPDVALGRIDGRDCLLSLTVVTRHFNVNTGALAVGRKNNLSNVTKGNTRISELTFNDDADFFLQRLTYALPMMLPAPLFRHGFLHPAKNLSEYQR